MAMAPQKIINQKKIERLCTSMERISIAAKGNPPLAVRYPRSDGQVCQKFRGKLFFQRNLCYHDADEGSRLLEQKLWRFSPGQEVRKTIFLTAVAKVAA